MERSTIFIASSGRTLTLAEVLRDELQTEYCQATLWNEESRRSPGATIIEMLQSAARKYDFAVIILARDDVMATEGGETLKARDNCIFEGGLFMAALGRERCFLVNSVPPQDLPSDLGGIISIPFTEPKNLHIREECTEAIMKVSGTLKNSVQRAGRTTTKESFPSLSPKGLLEKETQASGLQRGRVVVTSVQPLEVEYPAARQMRRNIFEQEITYVYFIHGSEDGAQKSCLLLQMMLLAEWLEPENANSYWHRLQVLKENQREVLADLTRICQQQSLKIIFSPDKPALEYCIHNAGDDTKARLYLKHATGRYVEWAERRNAFEFWEEIKKQRLSVESHSTKLCATSGFEAKNREGFYDCFNRELEKYFPEIHSQVQAVCFGLPETHTAAGV